MPFVLTNPCHSIKIGFLSSSPLSCMASLRLLLLFHPSSASFYSNRKQHTDTVMLRCSPPSQSQVQLVSRRSLSVTPLLLLLSHYAFPSRADAGGFLDRYVKRKKLDPLEVYIPVVLLTQEQFRDLEKSLDLDHPNFDISRSLLRSGPASSLRVNIRAVAQYASDDGKEKLASEAVDGCLRALEDLDAMLLLATRNGSSASVEMMKNRVDVVLTSIDSLLKTVPPDVLGKGREIANAYREPSYLDDESRNPKELDKDIKELEEIL
ncbi:hypothetical protein ZOSMA_87G00140 [Zostera marina]|uniref:DUF7880 domain-containing protein n=1 Tax=Zostera marina TaxID=29655 RepID=A0A0K9NMG9_ZOSMR|nr:hypothetical protein ZOSMA_87G00140 [Zostera marina]